MDGCGRGGLEKNGVLVIVVVSMGLLDTLGLETRYRYEIRMCCDPIHDPRGKRCPWLLDQRAISLTLPLS